MKNYLLPYLAAAMSLLWQPTVAQTANDTSLTGLPGDNLDLYAVLNLFQKSKTIEDFEKSLNEQKTGINNLDLDLDKKVDFIKVVTKKKDSSFTFILQVAVSKTETQDVAVILLDKEKNGKVSLQIVGDEALYGKNYVVAPSDTGTPSVTANPAYKGPDPVIVNVPATQTIIVQSAPIVQYVYSPAYVPYVPPYYYGFYPPYFAAFTIMAVGIYRHNNYYHHGGYYGGNNTVVINNRNNFNNYNNNKMRSSTVSDNMARGNYNNGDRGSNGASASTRPSATPSDRPSAGTSPSNRPSATPSDRPSAGTSPSNRPSTTSSDRASTGTSASTRSSTSNFSSGSSMGGGGRNMSGGGGSRGGGGGGGGRRR